MRRYVLTTATPVLSRPDGSIQVGWDPRRAVVMHPPPGLAADILAELLRAMQASATIADLQTLAADRGGDASAIPSLIDGLVHDGVVMVERRDHTRAAAIRVHGNGPLSDLLIASLRCSGVRISQSSRTHAGAGGADLVVLTDYLVADPRVVRDLHDAAVPHLAVRMRDGTGLVGPLVIPGVTSCLHCADLHRSDRDGAWPAVAAQLCRTVGTAGRATVLATVALALAEVDHVLRAVRDAGAEPAGADPGSDPRPARPAPPATLDTTLEFDVATGEIVARRWSRHPRCTCQHIR